MDVKVTQNGKVLDGDAGFVVSADSFGGTGMGAAAPLSNGASAECSYPYPYSSSDPIDVSLKIYDNFLNRNVLGSASGTIIVNG